MTQSALDDALKLIDAGRADGVDLLRQVASTGNPEGLFVLANLFWSGTMVPQNPPHGRLLFEYAASLGHPDANLIVTNLLASGVAGKRDWATATDRLRAEAFVLPARKAAADLIAQMKIDANGDPLVSPKPTILAERPRAAMLEQLLTVSECNYLVTAAESGFEPSMVYNDQRQLVQDPIRTSDGSAFQWMIEDPAIHAVNRRIAGATSTLYENGEPLQVLRYYPGQQYRPHFDWVDGASNQRILTVLIYLNDDYDGGQTAFVHSGLNVRGKTGDALVFSNALETGNADPLAEHSGLPVTAGTKYLATRWIREARWIA